MEEWTKVYIGIRGWVLGETVWGKWESDRVRETGWDSYKIHDS